MIFGRATRPVVMGRNGMVSSGHYLASLAGAKVLQEGGNAVDAALATSLTLSVVAPETSGPGGDLFALVSMRKSGKVEALNASGPAPTKASIEFFRSKGMSKIPTDGPLSIAIPGAVDGWMELYGRYGTLDLGRIAADAVGYAREGFPLYRRLAARIEEIGNSYPWIDRCYRKLLGDLRPVKMLVQKDLAGTLEQIVRNGREGFYQGELGARMCAAILGEGGILAQEDLRGKHAEWLEPLTTAYKDYLLFEQPPVSQGFLVLEMLNIIEGLPLDGMAPAESFGDPQVARLISKEHAGKRRSLITNNGAARRHLAGAFGSDTTYLCTADREGNAVSLIQSIFAPFGSRIVAGDTGMIMNNRLCSFLLDPSKANSLRPGKRPAHTLNSYMVFRKGEFFAVGGTPGNDDQPQSNVQILVNLLDRELDPQAAIEAPRWSHMPGTPPRLELPEELSLEEGFAPELISGLEKKGHKVKVVGRWSFGAAQVIARDPDTGTWLGGADPRREGYAIGW
ncbi:MAG: gamma-glutamyltransferase family protein [Deltaproteobacteria bacterium]|nr:gamma-glutamyltransferase family protein [Deltaproteobacteria bacterium]